ncbi:MAG: SRPBCC family protein [Trueperaceae bacterium]|nr:SRPBCC family protein [Trueperaceae bacterium]
MQGRHRLVRHQWVPHPPDTVFAFFSDAHNLERLTPTFLRLDIRTPQPIEMRSGTRIEYVMRLFGLPVRWRTRIDEWRPGEGFVDVQESGPYAYWRHAHRFEPVDGGTRLVDEVEYTLPFGWLGRLAHALVVRHVLRRIFDFRAAAIQRQYGDEEALRPARS